MPRIHDKICVICKRHYRGGHISKYCPECRPEQIRLKNKRGHQNRDWVKHRDSTYKRMLKNNFGMTMDDYNELLIIQNGQCAICGNLPKTKRLSVDHCHKTGLVRGLLCHMCNRLLGLAKDKAFVLQNASDYIQRSQLLN